MKNIAELPGPRGLPLVGNLFQFESERLHRLLDDWADEFGPLYRFHLAGKHFIVVGELDLITPILRDRPTAFRRLGSIESVFEELGTNGLFSAEGEEWRRQRAMTGPTFNTNHLRQFQGTLQNVVGRLLQLWDRPAEQGLDLKVQEDLMRFTVDVTTNLAFGYDMNTLVAQKDVLQEHLKHILPVVSKRITAAFPYWRYFKLPKDRAVERALREISERTNHFITAARDRLKQNPALRGKPGNFIEALLAGESPERPFTNEEIFGTLITILLAGEDTTANSLAWMLHLVAENPRVQAELRKESNAVMEDGPASLTFEKLGELKYAEAVALETFRLRPVGPFLFLQANQDVRVGDLKVPKGTNVITLTGYCGFQEKWFSRPQEFIPERWLEGKAGLANHNPKALLAFGDGPRFCPGRSLAILEMKMVITALCGKYKLAPPKNGQVPKAVFHFVVEPQNLWVNLSRA